MYTNAAKLSTVLGAIALASSCQVDNEPWASAVQIERLDQTIGGEKALAERGDFLLENDKIRVIVLGARNDMGPGLFGGAIIDADVQRSNPEHRNGNGFDQLAEVSATTNMNVARPLEGQVSILADGSDGGPAIVRVNSGLHPFLSMLDALWALVRAPDQWMITDYELSPGQSWVKMTTTVYYGWDGVGEPPGPAEDVGYHDETMPVIDWAVETGVVIGDFYLQGGSIDVFAPGIGFDEDGAVFEAFQAERNMFTDPFGFEFLGGAGDGVSYGIAPKEGTAFVPLFTAGQTAMFAGGRDGDGTPERFADGTALQYERYFFIGDGDMGSIVDGWIEVNEMPFGTVHGNVVEEGTGHALSGVHVFVYKPGDDKPWSQWESDVSLDDTVADGSFGGRLPPGDWELFVHKHGRPDGQRIPITVTDNGALDLQLTSPRPGLVSFNIRDDDDVALPAKLSVYRVSDGEPACPAPRENLAPQRDPVLGDGFIGGAPEMVFFAMYGEGELELPDGTYCAAASRGTEYEIDWTAPFVVDASRRHHLDLQLVRSIETDGWVSADLHVHSSPSHDSGVLLHDRVRTMATEGVEFFAGTDHDVVTDYAPVIEELGMEDWVQSAVGVETTTVEVGHYLSFPMQQDFLGSSGGAIDWTDMTPAQIIDGLEQQGRQAGYDPLIFIGHPRSGILGYFDQYGFSPYGGSVGLPGNPGGPLIETPTLSRVNDILAEDNVSWNFDALEMLNGKRFDYLRTPTQPELSGFGAGDPDIDVLDFVSRTMEEQQALIDGTYMLGAGIHGDLDDWFTLLNLGFKFTVLGNSDTHSFTSTESGCPRNYIMSDTDDPAYIDDQAMADAVRDHRVVASYGPFMRMWVDDKPIGEEFVPADADLDLRIEVQAPTWMDVDRVELYQNGTLIREWDESDGSVVDGDTLRFSETIQITAERDSWFVAVAMGDESMSPVFTPVEIPYVELQEIVVEALAGVASVSSLLSPAIPVPRKYDVFPYAITNPIWVDVDGVEGFNAPGVPDWMVKPVPPEEEPTE